jgi:hypothetical protein
MAKKNDFEKEPWNNPDNWPDSELTLEEETDSFINAYLQSFDEENLIDSKEALNQTRKELRLKDLA